MMSAPECPSPSAQGRPDRCGLFSFPPRCASGASCLDHPEPAPRQNKIPTTVDGVELVEGETLIIPPEVLFPGIHWPTSTSENNGIYVVSEGFLERGPDA